MQIAALGIWDRENNISNYDFEESYRRRKASQETVDEALGKVEEVKSANVQTALDMMDRHNEMVAKSQKLQEIKARKLAMERQDKKRREEHTELLAEMAIRNAERHDLLEAARLKGK